jgi:hypothetical protein
MRNYMDLSTGILLAIPSREEIAALTDEEIQKLRNAGNCLDNALYLELLKRREAAQPK